MNQRTHDFNLCAEFGIADKIRAHCAGWNKQTLESARQSICNFLQVGVMGFNPRMVALFAIFYSDDPETLRSWAEVARDTLYSMSLE